MRFLFNNLHIFFKKIFILYGIEVLYPTGTKRTLEAAVRCCITTSAMQMTGQVTAQYIGQYGVEYVCTSAHMGARVAQKGQPVLAGHDNWQGRIFKIRGSEPGFPNLLESTGYDIVDGTGKVVNPLGLYGYNCKHSVQPCSKDSRNPWRDKDGNLIIGGEKIDSEKNRKAYEISQKARYMERSIRETKRNLLMKEKEINGVAETDVKDILQPEYDKLAYKLRMQNKRYNEFCEKNELKKQYDRIKKSGFDRKQSVKANGAATRYANQNELPKETDRFKTGNGEPKNSTESSVPQNITSDILYGKKVKDFTKTAKEINAELDSICIRESKWSGRIIIDDKLRALGQKEWNCDIKLVPKADYATELHELLHARSASYYDAKTYKKYRKMEEGTVELLTEEICKKKEISFTSAYVEELKHLRRINRRAKLYMDEYSFAVDLLNIPLVDRSKWLIKRINNNYAKGILTGAEREGAFDSLVKILEEID